MLENKVLYRDKEDSKVFAIIEANASLAECYDFACQFKADMVKRMVEEQNACDAKKAEKQPEEVKPDQAV